MSDFVIKAIVGAQGTLPEVARTLSDISEEYVVDSAHIDKLDDEFELRIVVKFEEEHLDVSARALRDFALEWAVEDVEVFNPIDEVDTEAINTELPRGPLPPWPPWPQDKWPHQPYRWEYTYDG